MPTKVLSYEIGAPLDALGVHPSYDRAMVLVRLDGVPLGSFDIALRDGRPNLGEFRSAVEQHCWRRALERSVEPAPARAGSHSATVIVCTRERPDDLRRCLASLQAMHDDGQAIIVVDNNPRTSATKEVVDGFPQVTYLREDQQGQNSARNCGILAADTDLVVFTDDDAVADPNWLRAITAPFADPQVMCVTGLTMPLELESEAQEVFEKVSGFSRRGFERRRYRSPPDDPLLVGGIGAGVNMAFRRGIFEELGLMDPALGPGTPSMSGDDHEYLTRILRAGHEIVYEPAALNWHRHRRTWKELRQVLFAYGVGSYAAWTRSISVEREWNVLRYMFGWFRHEQAPALLRSLTRRPGAIPLDLVLAELVGCVRGPGRYLLSRRRFPKYRRQ